MNLHPLINIMGNQTKTLPIRYLVIEANTSYKILLGRPSLNTLGSMVSTLHPVMKFPSAFEDIVTMHRIKRWQVNVT